MEGIRTQSDRDKSEKRKKLIVGGILIFLMLFSTAGFALNGIYGNGDQVSGDLNEPYNNGQYWVYPIEGEEFYFVNKLDEVKDVNLNFEKKLGDYAGINLYVDSENFLVLQELSINLGRYVGRFQEACYGSCERDLPEKECSENLIVFRENEESKVSQEENCIFIEGDLKTVDAFIYRILNIKKFAEIA